MDGPGSRRLILEGKCSRCGSAFRRDFAGFADLVAFARDAQNTPVLCETCAPTELVQ